MSSTQLTSVDGFNIDNIIFSKPEVGNIPNSIPKISFKRVRIATKYGDGSSGDLIIETPPNLYSFGLSENREMGSGNVNGYVLPICLWNKNNPTDAEKQFTDTFDKIVNKCKEHLLAHKDEIERYDLDMSDLKGFNPLYWKKEKGKIVEGQGPIIYIKVMMSKKDDKITTMFVNEETTEEMSANELMGRRCYVKGAFKIESIFIGNKISLQLKLYEAIIRPIDTERKSLLCANITRRPNVEVSSSIFEALETPVVVQTPNEKEENGSLKDESEEESEEEESEEEEEEEVAPSCPVGKPCPPTPPPPPPKKTTAVRGKRATKS